MRITIERFELFWWHANDESNVRRNRISDNEGGEIKGDAVFAILYEDEALLGKQLKSTELREQLRMRIEIDVSNALGRRASKQTPDFRVS